ncbi:Bestrophin, RFP-TM, chloride channel-domain-containing protein [Leucosporidium creatinivorum]|uniref:Bestrophin, RFP-TM, chloride channel-domain-containing protein n=1 Tax=Leucosporidium creatinivorum TaxID=106004 RepID=A0A1Y2FTW6_9BASI|nr:Bestrophin, RFP-TM, chloride channel-domain-containing protein [Leucosporidium creatinivorum]
MLWIIKRLNQTVLPEVLAPVLAFTCISVAVTVAAQQTSWNPAVNTIMLSVLTTMLSFAISLRTSSAVERFGEGRKAWSTLTRSSRDFAMLVWLHTPPTTLTTAELASIGSDEAALEVEKLKGLLEKRTIINLIQAFSVSAKHYLRGESGVYYEDLYDLIACLPRYSFPSSVAGDLAAEHQDRSHVLGIWRSPGPDGSTLLPYEGVPSTTPGVGTETPGTMLSGSTYFAPGSMGSASSKGVDANTDIELGLGGGDRKRSKITLLPSANPPRQDLYHFAPIFKVFRPLLRLFGSRGSHERECIGRRRPQIQSNVPLEISLFLSGWVSAIVSRGTLPAPYVSVIFGSLNALQDCIATLERVLTTPLPWAYSLHLRATTYAYLVFLPFQIYSALGYLTILATFVAATIFLGFLELGTQLENPFGYDDSDLDLDHFCELIAAELREIVAHPQPAPSTFVFSPLNTPFLPSDGRSAPEVLNDLVAAQDARERGEPLLRKMFMKHYHDSEALGGGKKGKKRRVVTPSRSVDVFSV